ncbi:glycosyltransferase family 2 protein [Perlabentimonas gracilis]|uniref:glycosyltransferase family 2 protein n=1 Tax=Perlabentimonas gracilis TaxID=2715279 RepID=UPI0014077DB8|nr:glycosyltransferase family 2 protein [Perlabentimonas gracilis]NHB68455.1 glycosyltransferase family 2 protein [Perlabentimonas gracilis]
MYQNKLVAIVIPSYNEAKNIASVISGIPTFVDHIVVVDDASKDNTAEVVRNLSNDNKRLVLLQNSKNLGCGGALATGYKWAIENNIDIAVRMDGDGQMDANDIERLVVPIAMGEVDYTKANRLFSGEAYEKIPKVRFYGNAILSLLTKIASGYWHIADSQSGFSAIGKQALQTVNWDKMYKRYGNPNDVLILLNIFNFRVRDVITQPIYNVGEKSTMRVRKVVFTISWLLIKRFFYRLREKYIIRDFHPLVFFYFFGFLLQLLSIPLFIRYIYYWIEYDHIPKVNFLAWMFAVIMGVQFILFAMWFDMDSNKHLR